MTDISLQSFTLKCHRYFSDECSSPCFPWWPEASVYCCTGTDGSCVPPPRGKQFGTHPPFLHTLWHLKKNFNIETGHTIYCVSLNSLSILVTSIIIMPIRFSLVAFHSTISWWRCEDCWWQLQWQTPWASINYELFRSGLTLELKKTSQRHVLVSAKEAQALVCWGWMFFLLKSNKLEIW